MSSSSEFKGVEYYIIQADATNPIGPASEETVKEWIAQKRISETDLVTRTGTDKWIALNESQFASDFAHRISLDHLAASTCPNCGAEMVVLSKGSQTGLWLIIIGVILTPVFCIGTVLWVWGMILRHGTRGKIYYQCPRCKYATA